MKYISDAGYICNKNNIIGVSFGPSDRKGVAKIANILNVNTRAILPGYERHRVREVSKFKIYACENVCMVGNIASTTMIRLYNDFKTNHSRDASLGVYISNSAILVIGVGSLDSRVVRYLARAMHTGNALYNIIMHDGSINALSGISGTDIFFEDKIPITWEQTCVEYHQQRDLLKASVYDANATHRILSIIRDKALTNVTFKRKNSQLYVSVNGVSYDVDGFINTFKI